MPHIRNCLLLECMFPFPCGAQSLEAPATHKHSPKPLNFESRAKLHVNIDIRTHFTFEHYL